MPNAFDVLQERGFFYQLTDEAVIRDRLANHRVTFYVGFDPTADSLHLGHLLPVMASRFLQQCGHRAIMLVGGGTACVGDPSGKTESRQMLSRDVIAANAEAIKGQIARYLDFSTPERALLVNNADWLADLKYIEFLRDIGKHFSVNRMLQADSVKLRLASDSGLTFLEFNYMLLQAYDFYVLARDQRCEFQFGGQDQWGNIVAGVDLTRRLLGQTVFGATFPLLTNAAGQKFGKSIAGAVWLDPQRTSIFDFYQFWRNVEDSEVTKLMGLFTALPMDEVRRLGSLPAPAINRAKEILAYEATALAHGTEAAAQAYQAATRQFGNADPEGKIATSSALAGLTAGNAADNLPTLALTADRAAAGVWIVALLVESGLAKTNSDARRLIQGGGVTLNDAKVDAVERQVTAADFRDGQAILRAGKKNVRRLTLG
jgi:tyrosyl-tRNA synthetase